MSKYVIQSKKTGNYFSDSYESQSGKSVVMVKNMYSAFEFKSKKKAEDCLNSLPYFDGEIIRLSV